MLKIGIIITAIGVGALVFVWFTVIIGELYSSTDVPMLVKLGVPIAFGGVILIIVATIINRMDEKRKETFKEVDN